MGCTLVLTTVGVHVEEMLWVSTNNLVAEPVNGGGRGGVRVLGLDLDYRNVWRGVLGHGRSVKRL